MRVRLFLRSAFPVWALSALAVVAGAQGGPGGGPPGGGGGGTNGGPSVAIDSQYLKYIPESGSSFYQIREGLDDTLAIDLVTPIDWFGNAICMKRGSEFKVMLVDTEPGENVWEVLSAKLYSEVTGEVYWEQTSPSGTQDENTTWPATPITLPDHVEYLKLDIEYVASIEMGGPTGDPVTLMGSNEIFVVYEEPIQYMDIAWANLLRWSCEAARTRNDEYEIKRDMTWSLFGQGKYLPEFGTWYTETPLTGPEKFWLRAFLENGLTGQCNDFADFLSVATNSVGLSAHPTRSYSIMTILQGWRMVTHPYKKAGGPVVYDGSFAYHQFVLASGGVWDGALGTEGQVQNYWVPAIGWSLTFYEGKLVILYWIDYDGDGAIDPGEYVYVGGAGSPWSPTTVALELTTEYIPSPH